MEEVHKVFTDDVDKQAAQHTPKNAVKNQALKPDITPEPSKQAHGAENSKVPDSSVEPAAEDFDSEEEIREIILKSLPIPLPLVSSLSHLRIVFC